MYKLNVHPCECVIKACNTSNVMITNHRNVLARLNVSLPNKRDIKY